MLHWLFTRHSYFDKRVTDKWYLMEAMTDFSLVTWYFWRNQDQRILFDESWECEGRKEERDVFMGNIIYTQRCWFLRWCLIVSNSSSDSRSGCITGFMNALILILYHFYSYTGSLIADKNGLKTMSNCHWRRRRLFRIFGKTRVFSSYLFQEREKRLVMVSQELLSWTFHSIKSNCKWIQCMTLFLKPWLIAMVEEENNTSGHAVVGN